MSFLSWSSRSNASRLTDVLIERLGWEQILGGIRNRLARS